MSLENLMAEDLSKTLGGKNKLGVMPMPVRTTPIASAPAAVNPLIDAPEKAPALSHKEAAELRNIESAIRAAEKKVAAAADALHDPAIATDAEELHRHQVKIDEAQAKVDALFARWEDLEARSRG